MTFHCRVILACVLILTMSQLHHLCSAECQTAGKFGDKCQHECNCNSQCNRTTGVCSSSCKTGFEGPTCQKHNVALSKSNGGSSTYRYTSWYPDRAVDGSTNQNVNSGHCFVSNSGHSSSYWYVNLGAVFPMDNIVIYWRSGTTYRFNNGRVLVANATGDEELCATVSSGDADSNNVFRFNCSTFGSKLFIRHPSGQCGECMLELCEVQIFVCPAGFYGIDCNLTCREDRYGEGCRSPCGQCEAGTRCGSTDGLCPRGCQPGWEGDMCNHTCPNGTYGQNCSGPCSPLCSDGANCHHVTGACLSGSCLPGYRGDRCDEECAQGHFGQNCSQACAHCKGGDVCHHETGACPRGCERTWGGAQCNGCAAGWYRRGEQCGLCGHCLNFEPCDPETGVCPGRCQFGYKGDRCEQECDAGTYGYECTMACPACEGGEPCDHVTGECPPAVVSQKFHDAAVVSARRSAFSSGYSAGNSAGAGKGVGGLLGVALLVAVVALATFFFMKRRRQQTEKTKNTSTQGAASFDKTREEVCCSDVGADNPYETLAVESKSATEDDVTQ